MGQRLDNARSLYMEAIGDGDYERAIETYAGARYTQHSTPVRDGKAGFKAFFADFVERNPVRDIKILRAFEDGPYVFLHVLQDLDHGQYRYVTADIFETDDEARLIEHWDIIAELGGDNGSGHSEIDGPTEATDLDRTDANKALVRRFLTDILVDGRHERIADYVSATGYVEHGRDAEDGLGDLVSRLSSPERPIAYERIHNVIGSGSFVAALSRATRGGTPVAVIDLYRVAEGLVVEHWDVAEEITPEDTWVNSGKF